MRVLGLGNVLMGDDAFGPWVIEELLARWEFPEDVTLLDVGTPGLDLTPYLAGADTILLLDTVRADAPPGTIRIYSRAQLLARPPQARVSPHDPGLAEALFTLAFADCAPRDVTLIGAVPELVATGIGLTSALRRAVDRAADEVVNHLAPLGLSPRLRRERSSDAPWWERPASARALSAPPAV